MQPARGRKDSGWLIYLLPELRWTSNVVPKVRGFWYWICAQPRWRLTVLYRLRHWIYVGPWEKYRNTISWWASGLSYKCNVYICLLVFIWTFVAFLFVRSVVVLPRQSSWSPHPKSLLQENVFSSFPSGNMWSTLHVTLRTAPTVDPFTASTFAIGRYDGGLHTWSENETTKQAW